MAYRLSQPEKIFIFAVAKKLVAMAYLAKMAYCVCHDILEWLPL